MTDQHEAVVIVGDFDGWKAAVARGFQRMTLDERLRYKARVLYGGQKPDTDRTPWEGIDPAKDEQP